MEIISRKQSLKPLEHIIIMELTIIRKPLEMSNNSCGRTSSLHQSVRKLLEGQLVFNGLRFEVNGRQAQVEVITRE